MTSALGAIEAWPVRHAATVVVGRTHDDRQPRQLGAHGDLDRTFALASVTKLLTAYATLVAIEEEIVDLDAPVADVPGATLRHLLAHASGIGPDGRRLADPGTRRIYSNAGFDVVASMVADAAEMPFSRYATEAVLQPLAMTATSLDGSPASDAASTAADLARFAAELLDPQLVAPATLTTATTVAFPGLDGVLPGYGKQQPNDWGLGFELRDHKSPHWTGARNSPRTFGHFGQSGTFLWVDRDADIALVCLTDRDFGNWALDRWPELADAVLSSHLTG